jgi:hypothetical protein
MSAGRTLTGLKGGQSPEAVQFGAPFLSMIKINLT